MVSSENWLWIFRAGVGFLLLSALLFLLGFATDYWHDDDVTHYGLWETCTGSMCSTHNADDLPAYHMATQALQILAVAFYGASPILHFVFYCQKTKKDTGWRSRILDVGYSIGIAFHLSSLMVFGLENSSPENFAWSFGMTCASVAIAFLGIIMIIVSRNRALQKFTFRTTKRNKRKTHAGNVGNDGLYRTATFSNSDHSRDEKLQRTKPDQSPQPNVNIVVNINTVPSTSAHYTSGNPNAQSAYDINNSSSFSYSNQQSENSDNANPASGEFSSSNQAQYDPTQIIDNATLMQVRPAPKSSTTQYSSPSHRKVFGPAERTRMFEDTVDSSASYSSTMSTPTTVSSLVPTAPSYNDTNDGESPPAYSEVVAMSSSNKQ